MTGLKITVFLSVFAGILFNTSIINFSEFNIPLFYGIVPVLLFYHFHFSNNLDSKIVLAKIEIKRGLIFGIIIVLILFFSAIIHVFAGIGDSNSELKQMISRLAFIVYYFLNFLVLIKRNGSNYSFIYAKNILKIFILYGIYQFFADTYQLPVFLNFLRNSSSYNISGFNKDIGDFEQLGAGGWLETYRAYSIWAEPSFSALPVALFLYTLNFYSKNTKEAVVWGGILLTYVILTYARSVWITTSFILLIILIFKNKHLTNKIRSHAIQNIYPIILIFFIFLSTLFWANFSPIYMQDLSSIGRSSSVIIGFQVFLDNFFVGTGMNSFKDIQSQYSNDLYYYNAEPIVHNLFVGYLQQMGLFGLIYSLLPIFYILSLRQVDIEKRLIMALIFASIGVFVGDFYYSPFPWLILAMLGSQKSNNQLLKI
jgi:hypothetical protein